MTVDIPEGVKDIYEGAFYHCTSLTTISFPTTLEMIGKVAFNYCKSLQSAILSHTKIQFLDAGAFYQCKNLETVGKLP
ncbi:hypothetical protein TrLO_g13218 [Triparma laevis f. longispina]|uniref:Leucine-rich repeat domain-containing protein n=1 Tax=Triparma laevis f. longispina TaxID=1714387 RepID=A0A9W7CG40_9STRA|nr:hypothetical protein TrLO_g13218 [Triparma laevis f. longispina]